MRIFGKGFNFGQDGPGNRLVYHLSGCNMHCIWCSNADGISSLSGKEVTAEEILRECESAKPMFFSGGGVTFTGGEPSLQEKELLYVLKELKARNIHTALETNATSKNLLKIAEHVDFLIMDFKHYDSEMLKKYTGIGNETIKENYEKLCLSGRELHVRIPLINGINAHSPEEFARYLSLFANDKTDFEFLPYHEYGREKWRGEYKVKNGFINKDTLADFCNTFKKYNLKVLNVQEG